MAVTVLTTLGIAVVFIAYGLIVFLTHDGVIPFQLNRIRL